jgi:uncharacterized protein
MTRQAQLTTHELDLMRGVFRHYREITGALLFGSRAKGTASVASDIDVAVLGAIDQLRAEAIASALDELALPYHFDVKAFDAIEHQPLREHIERVGIKIY